MWQEYRNKIEKAYKRHLAETKSKPNDKQMFSVIRKQFVRGAAFLPESTRLIMVMSKYGDASRDSRARSERRRRRDTTTETNMEKGAAEVKGKSRGSIMGGKS